MRRQGFVYPQGDSLHQRQMVENHLVAEFPQIPLDAVWRRASNPGRAKIGADRRLGDADTTYFASRPAWLPLLRPVTRHRLVLYLAPAAF
jgi:hypothetical protein